MAKKNPAEAPRRASASEPEPESQEEDTITPAPGEEQETEPQEQEEPAEKVGGEEQLQTEEEEEELSTVLDTEEYQEAQSHTQDSLAALNYSISLLAKEVKELRIATGLKLDSIHGLIAKNLKRGRSPVVPGAPRAKRRSGTPHRGQYED